MSGLGGFTTFNVGYGFLEALQRGYRLGFLTEVEFLHVTQCENLEDVKMNLAETDYAEVLQNEPSPITPTTIRERCLDKLVAEFEFLHAQAPAELAKFMDYITYDYMIDNVMLVLKATLNNPTVDVKDLVDQAHPLGKFKESTLKSICAFENTPRGYAELYQTVLIDTPIGPYFEEFLKAEGENNQQTGEVRDMLREMPTTKLENWLRKLYLEDFHNFCEQIGGETGTIMCHLLKARADAAAINITLNSFGTALNDPNMRQSDRKSLYPSIGYLYPAGTDKLSFVGDEAELAQVLRDFPAYRNIFEQYQNDERTIDDAFYAREVELNEIAFDGQFNFACFYSYVRLKEQEIRNLVWTCECIVQRQKNKMRQHFIPIFSRESPWRY